MSSWDLTLPSLCDVFSEHFKIGNVISPPNLVDEDVLAMFRHHYNAVAAENAMKPMYVAPEPGVYDFTEADKIVDWAEKNDLAMIGHTLCWHGQSAPWLNRSEDGAPLSRCAAKANLESFIQECVSRYSGRIYSWDVINEAFIDSDANVPYTGDWRDYVRRETSNPRAVGHWFLAYANGAAADEHGADYIFDAFYFARKYDPAAVLYYNEYNEEFEHKTTAISQMVAEINDQWKNHPEYDGRLLIEGIGMQSHHNHKFTDVAKIRAALTRFAALGVKVSITEMDFTFGSEDNPAVPLSAEDTARQADMYAALFTLYTEFSHVIERVAFWGLNDAASWRSWGSPTFFDVKSQAKPAFFAAIECVRPATTK